MKTVYEHTEKKTVLGEIEYKLEELRPFIKGITFFVLLNTILLSIILARVLWGCHQ